MCQISEETMKDYIYVQAAILCNRGRDDGCDMMSCTKEAVRSCIQDIEKEIENLKKEFCLIIE